MPKKIKIIAVGLFLILAIVIGGFFWILMHSKVGPGGNGPLTCNDSDNGKNIYIKGNATSKVGKQTLHINADSCAIKNDNKNNKNVADYLEGLNSCSGDNCYVHESYCGEYKGSPLDTQEFIQCPNGCSDGVCLSDNKINTSDWQTYRNEEYGFEIKYPNDWEVSSHAQGLLSIKNTRKQSYFAIAINKDKKINIEELGAMEKINIGDRSGYKYFYREGAGFSEVILIQLGQDTLEISLDYFGTNGRNIEDTKHIIEKIINPILSTFKFTDSAGDIEISCTDQQRKAEVCAEIYAPVCATVEIQCIKAPCNPIKQTFSNTCEACKNSLVRSYVNGECVAQN